MTQPYERHTLEDFDWNGWEHAFQIDEDKSWRQNVREVVTEVLKANDEDATAFLDIDWTDQPVRPILVVHGADYMHWLFDLREIVIEAAHHQATNFAGPWDDKTREDVSISMTVMRNALADLVDILDQAVANPERFHTLPAAIDRDAG